MSGLSAELSGVFGKLSRSMGQNYVRELLDPQGWNRIPDVYHQNGAEREGEIVLTKPVPGTDAELRLFRWDTGSCDSDPFRYSIEVGPIGFSTIISFGAGLCRDGEPQISAPFERAFALSA